MFFRSEPKKKTEIPEIPESFWSIKTDFKPRRIPYFGGHEVEGSFHSFPQWLFNGD